MTIILVGLNHRTAPVALREKLALTGVSMELALKTLGSPQVPIHEAVILSTCNRLEVYAVVHNRTQGWQHVGRFLAALQDIPIADLQPHLYQLEEADAVQHLMRVASGLDSMILGEPQILGQVGQAFDDARSAGLTGPLLNHLFAQAIHAGKRARTDTSIARFTTSVSHAGALMVLEKSAAKNPKVLVVGAGEMALLAAKALSKHGVTQFAFFNRTSSRAETLAQEFGGQTFNWHQLSEALTWADAVITATGAPHILIYANNLAHDLPKRNGRPLLFVDIAVPRDVDVAVSQLEGVERYDIDDLHSIVDANTAQRETAVPEVEAIIETEQNSFMEWYHGREVTPIIQNLRQWANEVAELEVNQALNKLQNVDDHTSHVVNRMAHRIVNKLLHEPTVRLRGQAVAGNGHGYAHAVSELFGLQVPADDAVCDVCGANTDLNCDLQCILPTGEPQ